MSGPHYSLASGFGASTSCVRPMDQPLQKPFSILQRHSLNQPCSTSHWVAAITTSNMPIQHWILRDFGRFWNRILQAGDSNKLVQCCLAHQLYLLQSNKRCWLRKWRDAFDRVLPSQQGVHFLKDPHGWLSDFQAVDAPALERILLDAYDVVLQAAGDPLCADCPNRRLALTNVVLPYGHWGKIPEQLRWDLPAGATVIWRKFVCANSDIPVHEYSLSSSQFDARHCRKCGMNEVGDEHHVLFCCPCTAQSRRQFQHLLMWPSSFDQFFKFNVVPDCAKFVVTAIRQYVRSPINVM